MIENYEVLFMVGGFVMVGYFSKLYVDYFWWRSEIFLYCFLVYSVGR